MRPLGTQEVKDLCEKARQAAQTAYAPYSKFRVGAAVMAVDGVYTGANVENASYPVGICAERVGLSKAITDGQRKIEAIAVACIDASPDQGLEELMPCGACRQWMVELAPDATVLICGVDGSVSDFTIGELLPNAFRLGAKGE